jgi:Protein of unknown function (DUF3375)
MDYITYQNLLNTSIHLKLLRANNAPLILCFLQMTFKAKEYTNTISNEKLVGSLADFLESEGIGDEEGDISFFTTNYDDKSTKYIKNWVRDGYLSLYTDEQGQDLHSLTPEMESVLEWITSLFQKQSFIGTESRFLDIFHKLRELVKNTSEDWQTKVAELEKERDKIDEQIRQLQITQTVQTFEDYQIISRFNDVNTVARSLMRDFREVENNFVDLSQQVYQKQTEQISNKGDLLGFTLDALDELRLTPQGRSFEAFYQHLTSPIQKEELDQLVKQVFVLMTERGINTDDKFLKRIKSYLHSEGQKVNDSFNLLVKKLQKLIAEKNIRDRKKSLQLINQIKSVAFEVMENPPKQGIFLEIEDKPDYQTTNAEVSLSEGEAKIVARVLSKAQEEDSDLDVLVNKKVVDKEILRNNIASLLRSQSQVSLKNILSVYELKHGLSELMAYASIASTGKHIISENEKDIINISPNRAVEFPEIIFCK